MKMGSKVKALLRQEFVQAKSYGKLTPGKALRIYRELQCLTQSELAKLSGLKQATISSLEHERVTLGVERAKALASALKVHPSVLAFADCESESNAA